MKDMQMQLDYKDFKKCIFRINMQREGNVKEKEVKPVLKLILIT